MTAKDYLQLISDEIHTTIVATVDDKGLPVTAAIDMMMSDESGLYFLTARGKSFYDRLTKRGNLALTALKGEDTMHSLAVSLRGKVRELGHELLPVLFEKNPYMAEIYPTEASREALTVFQIYEGSGEYFDLSKRPIERASLPSKKSVSIKPSTITSARILNTRYDPAGALSPLRQLSAGLPGRSSHKKVRPSEEENYVYHLQRQSEYRAGYFDRQSSQGA